ncbi:23S rRNA (adenine(2030)-N(6))-methyltransferase RlmJ [Acidocella facilis]|uniref:23S rRNA (adenine(2030)-N(6))-methyltransferase RlmJ n=1 Tax=Acidocella facilis TaxID=525 RepID=UPI001F19AB0B|nr:23S rRNA (adenine(2030)-N(6))-methyltransferase RlmJ [Acidocella facilis]
MNYRHIYHAGNFADVMKHALLLRLLAGLQRKPKPFLVLDTHAGLGAYDVTSEQAEKTGEWRDGIGRLLDAPPPALADYVETIRRLGLYPGSPLFTIAALRSTDRLIACELHPEDAQILRRTLRPYANAAAHERDGYEALGAFLPPPEKRALVLIDPPFERTDEFAHLAKTLAAAWRKFPSGVYVVWYPIKHRAPVRGFFEALRLAGVKDLIAAELLRRPDTDPTRLNGAGLAIINPPFGFEAEALPILEACRDAFGEAGASVALERIINE